MKIRIGIVGVGNFSDDFIRLFLLHPDVEKVALADLDSERLKASGEKYGITDLYPSLDEMLKELYNTYKCKAVKEKVADLAVKRFLTRYKYASDFEGGLEYLKSVVEYFDLSSHYVKEYMKHKASLIGADFPENVVLVNADNEVVDFSTFKGKFVYIDLWTSWCVPCCKEIPHLQAIEKEFEDSDIVFVSISTDTDEDAWKERMEEYNMAGNQLLDSENNLTDVLNVSGIPFFVVYDKEGKLHTYDALRPSSGDKLKQFLLSLQ